MTGYFLIFLFYFMGHFFLARPVSIIKKSLLGAQHLHIQCMNSDEG